MNGNFYYIPQGMGKVDFSCNDWLNLKRLQSRRLLLEGAIYGVDDDDEDYEYTTRMNVSKIVQTILQYNYDDAGLDVDKRKPIVLYINSPGGSLTEGFSLVSTIRLSKTPVYTVNIGEWSSMAFLIGITGHKRFSLPDVTFLLHDGSDFAYGTTSKVQDRAKFNERYEEVVIRRHVLEHSTMTAEEYDANRRVEFYMLPEEALERGFIDEIVTDIDSILLAEKSGSCPRNSVLDDLKLEQNELH